MNGHSSLAGSGSRGGILARVDTTSRRNESFEIVNHGKIKNKKKLEWKGCGEKHRLQLVNIQSVIAV